MRCLLSLVAICVVASALTTRSTSNPTISFNVDRRFSLPHKSGKSFVQYERDRAQQLIARLRARAEAKERAQSIGVPRSEEASSAQSITVDNALTAYTTEVQIGSPSTTYLLDIDTGSSNLLVGAGIAFVPSSTTTRTSNNVSVNFGSASFSGFEVIDQVALSPELVINQQSIGVATESQGLEGLDGILGCGPTDLTLGTLSPASNTEIPTVVDNLRSQGTIPNSLLSIFFAPETSAPTSAPTGEMTFGSTDPTKITTPVNFVSITKTSPASEFWGIDQSVTYAGKTILSSTAGIVDTGTTLLILATDAFDRYKSATGAVLDDTTGFLKVTQAQFNKLQPLEFHIGNQVYSLTPNAQRFPQNLNVALGGEADGFYLVIADLGVESGSGLDFVNGYVFLERFYSVYDTDNKRVGFAQTAFTNATTN